MNSWIQRTLADKILDAGGLLIQGLFVPMVAQFIATAVLPLFFQTSKIEISSIFLFLLPLTLIDYVYYWNHRALHSVRLWWLHQVHHTSTTLDVFVTSRNSFWTSFALVYVWVHAYLLFQVSDPTYYVYGIYVHGALDIWRHSGWKTPKGLKWLSIIFILPEFHAWHHSDDISRVNFGANLNIWDRIHGTFHPSFESPKKLGCDERFPVTTEFLFPWKMKS